MLLALSYGWLTRPGGIYVYFRVVMPVNWFEGKSIIFCGTTLNHTSCCRRKGADLSSDNLRRGRAPLLLLTHVSSIRTHIRVASFIDGKNLSCFGCFFIFGLCKSVNYVLYFAKPSILTFHRRIY